MVTEEFLHTANQVRVLNPDHSTRRSTEQSTEMSLNVKKIWMTKGRKSAYSISDQKLLVTIK